MKRAYNIHQRRGSAAIRPTTMGGDNAEVLETNSQRVRRVIAERQIEFRQTGPRRWDWEQGGKQFALSWADIPGRWEIGYRSHPDNTMDWAPLGASKAVTPRQLALARASKILSEGWL